MEYIKKFGDYCRISTLFGYENGLGYTAYAIHNYGVGQASSSYNAAVLMNDWLLNAINKF